MPPLTSSQSVTSLSRTLTSSRTSRIQPTTISTISTMSTTSQQRQQQQQSHHHHHANSRSQTQLALLKLSSIIPPSSTNLQINLIEPVLYFRGDSEESVGCFLRGKVYYGSTSNRNELCEEREIFAHNWTFLSSSTSSSETSSLSSALNSGSNSNRFKILRCSSSTPKFNLIPAGIHKYPFELFIPGNIPETIEAERGTVNYKLSATAIRPGLFPNLHVSQHVPIIRTILEERNSEGIVIASEWNNQLGYEITIPKKAYPIGDSIDIDLKLNPKAKKVNVVGIKIQIEEESVYKTNGQKNFESRTLLVHKVNNFAEQMVLSDKNYSLNNNNTFIQEGTSSSAQIQDDDETLFYHKNISLPIPKCTSPICFSYKSSSINISHYLKFIFTVKPSNNDENGKKKKKKFDIKVDVPITILSCRCAEDLPQYEDDSPSYESPPSYEQSTRRQSQRYSINNNEIRHNSTNTITTITNHPPLERLLTV
ncbi:cyclin binding protein [Rhizophagus clarus]|uniref:Cyclin binding protein n=1 Tax=Rhizophagus clarus TaxID=94130 RepID=A0A8H3LR46_9GLOM|nr:cyclin binding protein [Rhizophagus clarus]